MDDRASRVFTGLSVLVVLWIAVYWLWEPSAARVTVAATPVSTAPEQESAPPRASGSDPGASVSMPTIPTQTTPPEVRTSPGVTPPEFRTVAVRSGDTFEKIAARELGDAALWTVVARANPLRDPRRLREGQEVRVPLDPSNVQGRPPSVTPTERAPEAPTPDPVPTHTVRSGDTLSGIAKSHYGSTVHARWIYDNNRDVLRDIDSISLGQTLRLPPLPITD